MWMLCNAKARDVKRFYMLPLAVNLMQYDTIAVNHCRHRKGEVVRVISFLCDLSLFTQIICTSNKWLKCAVNNA